MMVVLYTHVYTICMQIIYIEPTPWKLQKNKKTKQTVPSKFPYNHLIIIYITSFESLRSKDLNGHISVAVPRPLFVHRRRRRRRRR
jgi:hypothetical protein